MRGIIVVLSLVCGFSALCQDAIVRGFVYDAKTGEPAVAAVVSFLENKQGAYTDERGFYSISNIDAGTYTLIATLVGYDTIKQSIEVKNGKLIQQNFYLNTASDALGLVKISAEKLMKTKEVNISKTTIKPIQLTRIPSVGGEPDLVQYLQVLPGVVFSGDQGGQLYIRGRFSGDEQSTTRWSYGVQSIS